MTRGVPFPFIAFGKKRLAAATSRFAVSRKSTVRPCLSTARYRYVHRPFTFIYVSSQRHDPPTNRAYRLHRFSNSGTYRSTLLIDGTIQICPPALHIYICLVAAPRSAHQPGVPAPPLLQFRDVPLNPAYRRHDTDMSTGPSHLYMSRRSATIRPPTGRTGSTASPIPGRTVEPSAEWSCARVRSRARPSYPPDRANSVCN